nr:MAG TPA: Putative translation initiation inhibitor [Caudoviricetes sp.]
MDREDILLSDRLVPAYLPEFPDDRRSANEALASMVGAAKVYDRILTLADEHGLHVDGDEFSTLTVSSGGAKIGTMMVAMRRSGAELDIDPFVGEDLSKKPIWNHFVDDLTNDPVIEHSRTPVEATTRWRPAKPLTHSTRFHVYTKPMGEMVFVSGEVALTVDNVETLSWETNIGMIRSENIEGKVQEMFDRLVAGASVMDSLASVADACGITLAMASNFLIVAYHGGGIIGQIAVGASRSGVELVPSYLRSPDRSDAVEEAWGEFCGRIREIPDSRTV